MISHLWCGGPPSQGSDAGWQEEALTARSLSADSGRPEGECCACARLFRCLLVQQPCAGSGAHVAKTGSFEAAVRRDLSPSAGNTFSFLASDTDFGEASVELRGAAAWQRTESLRNGRFVKEYKIGEMLGQGAFGIVFAAKRRKPTDSEGNMLAVKLIDKVETHPGDIEREAAIHAKLDHPNILKVHDVIDERFFVCIVTDRFPGGDLVKCLHGCQRLKPSKTMHIVKQMLEGVCYLHNLAIVHRDVKADNFLTEKEEFLDPDCRVILADFGFACYCRTGDRLQRRCGTKMYWAPEIWDRNYAVKVDVWAVGVTVYGMMEGTFPFRTEWDMKSKDVTCHPMMSPKCLAFMLGLLTKAESRRPTAARALEHKWLLSPLSAESGAPVSRSSTLTSGACRQGDDEWAPDLEAFQAEKPDPAVTQRRLELVERLGDMWKPERHAADDVSLSSCDSVHKTSSQTLRKQSFVVMDLKARKLRTFEWWPCSRVEQDILGSLDTKCEDQVPRQETHLVEYVNTQLLAHVLQEHGIDTTQFGTGVSKTLHRLAVEMDSGASRLMLDASKHKALVRVVDVVLLRLSHCDLDGGSTSYLVVTADLQEHGQMRSDLNRLPGTKKKPHENIRQAIQRILDQIPNRDVWDSRVVCNLRGREIFEKEGESPSFPGVRTIYRTEVVTATTDVRFAIEDDIGQDPDSPSGIDAGLAIRRQVSGSTKFFSWMTEEECIRLNVRLSGSDQSANVSDLVPAPIGLKVRALERYLRANSVDPSLFGQGQAKTLQELSAELTSGESSLMTSPHGELVRLVDVVLLKIFRARRREVLVVTRAKQDETEEVGLNRLPGTKRRPDENHFLAAKRVLSRQLLLSEDRVKLDQGVHIVQEDKDSPSYPGLQTVYVKRIISVELFSDAEVGQPHVLNRPCDLSQKSNSRSR